MKKALTLAVVAVGVAIGLAGCGGEETNLTPSSGDSSEYSASPEYDDSNDNEGSDVPDSGDSMSEPHEWPPAWLEDEVDKLPGPPELYEDMLLGHSGESYIPDNYPPDWLVEEVQRLPGPPERYEGILSPMYTLPEDW